MNSENEKTKVLWEHRAEVVEVKPDRKKLDRAERPMHGIHVGFVVIRDLATDQKHKILNDSPNAVSGINTLNAGDKGMLRLVGVKLFFARGET